MFDWDTQFGDFRSTLQNTTLTKDELSDLIGIMNAARKEHAIKYAQEWLGYLLDSPFVQAQVPSLQGLAVLLKQWQSIGIHTAREGKQQPTFTVKVTDDTHEHHLSQAKNLSTDATVVPTEDRDVIQAFWNQLTPIIIHELAKYPTNHHDLYFLDEPNQDCGGGTTKFTVAFGQIKGNALLSYEQYDWVRQTWDRAMSIDEVFTDPRMLEQLLNADFPEEYIYDALEYPSIFKEDFPTWKGLRGIDSMAEHTFISDIYIADDLLDSELYFEFRNGDDFTPQTHKQYANSVKNAVTNSTIGPYTIDLGTTLLKAHIS